MLGKPEAKDFEATMLHYEQFRAPSCSEMENDGCKSSMRVTMKICKNQDF
jgi:hypothetical protein